MAEQQSDLELLPRFNYDDLSDDTNLRIVTIRAGRPESDTIDCELQEVRLKGCKFEALSWCWGKGKVKCSVRIHQNGTAYQYEVPQHLYEGLKALRLIGGDRRLWVDAICINQNNVIEKNQQVPRMSDIYGRAENVCIWLGKPADGKPEEDTRLAFEFVENNLLKLWNFDNLSRDKNMINHWKALVEVMKRAWFSRRWVIQEISLAPSGTVYCGRHKMEWRKFVDAVSLFVQVEETQQRLSELVRNDTDHNSEVNYFEEVPRLGASMLVKTTQDLFHRSTWGGHHMQRTLESLVSRLAIFQTSQPRDTVYALLSMARDTQASTNLAHPHEFLDRLEKRPDAGKRALLERVAASFPKPLIEKYEVNYKSRVIDVYQQFIAFAIRKADPTRALDIICRPFAPSYTKAQDYEFDDAALQALTDDEKAQPVPLPTWVPNVANLPFEMQPARRTDSPHDSDSFFSLCMERRHADPFVGIPEHRNYSAARTKPFNKSKLRFRKNGEDGYSMFAEGFVLDTVSHVGDVAGAGNIPPGWSQMIGWGDREKDPPDEAKFDAFWRTLVANRDSDGSDPPIYWKLACETVFKMASKQNTFQTKDWIEKGSTPIAEFLRRMRDIVWDRRMIETTGRRLSLTPEKTRVDDLVVILYGCSVPLILRKVSKTPLEITNEIAGEKAAAEQRREAAVRAVSKVFVARKAIRRTLKERKPSFIARLRQLQSLQQVAAQLRLWNVTQTIGLLGLSIWLWKRSETLTAVLIAVVTVLHFISYISNDFIEPALIWQSSAYGIVAAIVLVFAFAIYVPERQQLANIVAVLVSFSTLFPRLLPEQVRRSVQHLRRLCAERIKHLTDKVPDIPKDIFWKCIRVFGFKRKDARTNFETFQPRPYYFRLIGACYIHGMMEGEAIEWQNQNYSRAKPEVVEIR
jgi:hypothetical protein